MIRINSKVLYPLVVLWSLGCGNPLEESKSSSAAALDSDELPVLQVGTEGLYAPYTFCGTVENPETCASPADVRGFDIDIANAVCELIGHRCEFVINDWSSIFTNLAGGSYDTVFAAVGWREDRTRFGRYTISYEPLGSVDGAYFYTLQSLVDSLEFTPEGLAGQPIGVQEATLHEAYVVENFPAANVVTFGTQGEVNDALLDGTVVATLTNRDAMVQFVEAHPEVVQVDGPAILYEEGGFATGNIYALVRKHGVDPLLYDKINNAILKLQLNGYVQERHSFWVPGAP